MRNQPKYNFFKNTFYAIDGIKDVFKNETSFKIELIIVSFLTIIIFFYDISVMSKIILFSSMFFILIAEVINSAIERTVDLVSLEYSEMAKRAKDAGSAIVFLSIFQSFIIFGLIIYKEFNN